MNDYVIINTNDYLCHYGILGQKWGIRRYQNSDGSLTEEGKMRRSQMQNDEIERKMTKNVTKLAVGAGLGAVAEGAKNGLFNMLIDVCGVETAKEVPMALLEAVIGGETGALPLSIAALGVSAMPVASLVLKTAGAAGLIATGIRTVNNILDKVYGDETNNKNNKSEEMEKISNEITDKVMSGASQEELKEAVERSKEIIDKAKK